MVSLRGAWLCLGSTLDFYIAKETWVLTLDLFQLHWSDLFLAVRQEWNFSHSVVTYSFQKNAPK